MSWFWRNLSRKLDPSIEEYNKNFPMMFKMVTKDDIKKLETHAKAKKIQN